MLLSQARPGDDPPGLREQRGPYIRCVEYYALAA